MSVDTDKDDGHSAECTYSKCAHPESGTPCPFVRTLTPPTLERVKKKLAPDWDVEAIRKLTPEQNDDLASRPFRRSNGNKNRLEVPLKIRYEMLRAHPYCTLCGATVADGVRLEIDHMDGDPSNSKPENLQVLCRLCNGGKGETPWNMS